MPVSTLRLRLLRSGLPLLLVVAAAALLLAQALHQPVFSYDEGFTVYQAATLLEGDVPYRDFWTHYAPGGFYTLAAAFQMFGTSLFVERSYDTAVRVMIAVVLTLLVRRVGPAGLAVTVGGLFVVLAGAVGFFVYAMFPAFACCLLAIWCAFRLFDSRRRRWLVGAGVAIGCATLFKHEMGFYGFVSVGVVLAVWKFSLPSTASLLSRGIGAARTLTALSLVVVVTVAPVLIWLLTEVAAAELWQLLVIFPVTELNVLHFKPPPPLIPLPLGERGLSPQAYAALVLYEWPRFYAPLLIYGLAGLQQVRWWRRGGAGAWLAAAGPHRLLLVLGGLVFFNHAYTRLDEIHALPTTSLAMAVGVSGLPMFWGAIRARWARCLTAVALGVLVCDHLVVPLVVSYQSLTARACDPAIPRSGCIPIDPGQAATVRYIRANTDPGERIYVGSTRHDRALINDVMLYFLAERHSTTRYHNLHPGVTTTAPVQREMIASLENPATRYVVLLSAYEGAREANASGESSGVTLLDDYIRERYRPVERFGPYSVLRRAGG